MEVIEETLEGVSQGELTRECENRRNQGNHNHIPSVNDGFLWRSVEKDPSAGQQHTQRVK